MTLIRWILAIPLAVAIGVGILFLVFFLLPQLLGYTSWMWEAVFFGGGFLGGLAYMHVGCGVAPSHKMQVGWGLTALMAGVLAYFLIEAHPQDLDTLLTGGVCASATALVACLLSMLCRTVKKRRTR